MKIKFLTLYAAVFVFAACNNESKKSEESAGENIIESVNTDDNTGVNMQIPDSADVANAPIITFDRDTYDFSNIKEGEKVTHTFEFTNEGKSPLIISDVQAGCGCTTPKFDKKPIKPGENGSIEVGFNSAGQKGVQHKIITVYSNADPAQSMLHLKGEVQ
ncbi:DUF1573 domain-containing protein [Olivibacter sp. SDN3]|uniref:DUF1573 domain-containing protein n=1 Tax=Olivibacter sp. SDN3 TaxID=2764720 RepID=UPI001651AD4B|nr:DUF1573 domain-containing protein [Olivibacter sp. SDN3]QNL49523.1 DUF1573 domain-containing protein [Olivibacter sp. SDN3]